jgi:exopolysaccharide biosynthesis polyprenyl glycosylphosphotransferase
VLDRYSGVKVSRIGQIYSLNVVRRPLTSVDVLVKRCFDLAIGLPLLVALTPLFLMVALAVRLDSPGPVLFLQRRYGFNQEPFRIVKFRTMTVAEEGRGVRQAERDDPRVTRVGRILRRFNIDELPQLLNVARGEMSLVGPRPHALVHDQYYERSIADYARRHNVKPGITGWAQIHGLRGAIPTESVMRERIEHDLYYIDNWTIGLDIRILVMTLISPKAFTNAF